MPADFPGSCHCGAIGFSYQCDQPPSRWTIRACQCSFCRAHDALSTSDPASRIRFHASNPDQLQKYRFGLMTADFLLCRNCGVYVGAVISTPNGDFGIVNIHALDVRPTDLAATAPVSYDAEDTGGRVARREQRWSPVLSLPG